MSVAPAEPVANGVLTIDDLQEKVVDPRMDEDADELDQKVSAASRAKVDLECCDVLLGFAVGAALPPPPPTVNGESSASWTSSEGQVASPQAASPQAASPEQHAEGHQTEQPSEGPSTEQHLAIQTPALGGPTPDQQQLVTAPEQSKTPASQLFVTPSEHPRSEERRADRVEETPTMDDSMDDPVENARYNQMDVDAPPLAGSSSPHDKPAVGAAPPSADTDDRQPTSSIPLAVTQPSASQESSSKAQSPTFVAARHKSPNSSLTTFSDNEETESDTGMQMLKEKGAVGNALERTGVPASVVSSDDFPEDGDEDVQSSDAASTSSDESSADVAARLRQRHEKPGPTRKRMSSPPSKEIPVRDRKGKGRAIDVEDEVHETGEEEEVDVGARILRRYLQSEPCKMSNLTDLAWCHLCSSGIVNRKRATSAAPVSSEEGPGMPSSVCSFVGVRTINERSDGNLEYSFLRARRRRNERPQFQKAFEPELAPRHALLIRDTAATHLLPTLERELEHARHAVKQTLDLRWTVTCDLCLHAVLAVSYRCPSCGVEMCLDCHADLKSTEQGDGPSIDEQGEQNGGESLGEQNRRLSAAQRARLDLCKYRHGGERMKKRYTHKADEFIAFSRLRTPELGRIITEMREWRERRGEVGEPDREALREKYAHLYESVDKTRYRLGGEHDDDGLRFMTIPLHMLDAVEGGEDGAEELRAHEQTFHELWSIGEPVVIDLNERTDVPDGVAPARWTPRALADQFGLETCTVVRNEQGVQNEQPSLVGKFLQRFASAKDDNERNVKIKDWPSTADFKDKYPALNAHFNELLPAPWATRRMGALNVASHTPQNANAPDLGPKGYFSDTSDDTPGGQGSTRLHMDVADAVNIMMWSAPDDTLRDERGIAMWDIYRAEDADKLRSYILELKASKTGQPVTSLARTLDDPIHTQDAFLDSARRKDLRDKLGVKSFRIAQRPGQAVLIPAGCAHQVCNFADCIKVAQDFVSIENVARCWQVTQEYRLMTHDRTVWRSDVLQLKSQLLWAWISAAQVLEPS